MLKVSENGTPMKGIVLDKVRTESRPIHIVIDQYLVMTKSGTTCLINPEWILKTITQEEYTKD